MRISAPPVQAARPPRAAPARPERPRGPAKPRTVLRPAARPRPSRTRAAPARLSNCMAHSARETGRFIFLEVNLKLIVAALAAVGTLASTAHAAPRAESAQECGVAADMAVVAHSLAREDIQRPKADAIMVRIYDVGESDRGKELMRDITDAAYSSKLREPSASAGGTASSQN